jgi:hypothetical protein
MKMDKEALLKHNFWIVLGTFALVWVIAFLTIRFAAGGTTAALRKNFDDSQKSIDNALKSHPKNKETYIDPWDKQAALYKGIKNEVWKQAFDLQNAKGNQFATWPALGADRPAPKELDYPSAQVKGENINSYLRQYQTTLYPEQFKYKLRDGSMVSLDQLVAPIEFKGGTDGYKLLMAPTSDDTVSPPAGPAVPVPGPNASAARNISNFWGTDVRKVPTLEEAFLAQEDYWVKREMLQIIKAALDSSALMPVVRTKDKDGNDDKKDTGFHRTDDKIDATFRNATWELRLVLEQKKDAANGNVTWVIGKDSTIKNVSASKRMLDLKKGARFRLRQGTRTPDEFIFDGEMLAWNSEPARLGKVIDQIKNVDLSEPFDVQQVFDWESSPIKRVDDLRTAYSSHRTANVALKPGLDFPVQAQANPVGGPSPAPGPAPGPGPTTRGRPAPGPGGDRRPGPGPGPAPGPGGEGVAAVDTSVTDRHGILRNRYVHVTKECRHLPIALTLIVDQAHIHNVLIAVANSRLRIQTTQIQFQQTSGIKSQVATDETMPTPMPMPVPRPMGMGMDMDSSEDPNLVELTVYGIASLYERYPPLETTATPTDPTKKTP